MEFIKNPFNYRDLISHLENGKNFSFSRWGDGEIGCLFGKQGQNCDGHKYFPELAKSLKETLDKKPNYYLGMQSLGYGIYKDKINEAYPNYEWCNADILHNASIKNELDLLFKALGKRDVILVGHEDLSSLVNLTPYTHIVIPEKNCWEVKDDVEKQLAWNIQEDDVIIYCASMMTNVVIQDMYEIYSDSITQIDCGSVFEPYIGNSTRTYHSKIIEMLK